MSLTKQGILNHHSKVFDFLNRGLDMGIIAGTFVFAHYMNSTELDLSCTLMVLTALVYFELSAAMTGIYGSQRGYSTFQHLGNVVPALVTMFLLTICTALLLNRSQHLWLEPMLTTHWVMTCTVLMIGWRFSLRQLLVFLRKRGMNTRRVAIAGCSATAKSLADKIRNNPWMGLKIDGFYDDTTACHYVPIKGDFKKLLARVNQGLVEQVYIVLPSQEATKISALVDALSDSTATVFIIPDVFTFELMNSRQTSIDGIPAISIYDSPFSLGDSVLKRAFDIVVSLGILSVIGLPMLAIAAAVKLTSPGPAIFRQRRYGMDGKPIDVWKFRSMTVEDNGPVVKQATKNDSRITPLGALLRRTSLDELPQFINVLQGSMSIVGPRPHAVAHNEEYRKQIKGYMLRHKVKPGITGWAQINGWRGETDTLEKMEKRVEHDLHYIRHWNIWLDVQILFLTVFKGFVGKNVY